jgi:hypothetical protein
MCICYRENVFTEPLPNNVRGDYTDSKVISLVTFISLISKAGYKTKLFFHYRVFNNTCSTDEK